jgi:nucleotide-binding universal stress UspA family protein
VCIDRQWHTVQGQSVHSTLLEFAAREGIDILILGSRENKGTVQKLVAPGGMGSSTSDTVKSKSKCPCLIVRPAVGSLFLPHVCFCVGGPIR